MLFIDAALEKDILLTKIDVQGYEPQVLKGGQRTINNTKYILLEICDEPEMKEIKQILGENWKCKKITSIDYLFFR